MKLLFLTSLLLLSTSSLAKILEFNLQLKFKSKDEPEEQSTAKVFAKLGQEFSVQNNKFKTVFVATHYQGREGQQAHSAEADQGDSNSVVRNQAISLVGRVYEIREGRDQVLVSRPQIITLVGQEATIRNQKGESEYFEVKVVPREVQ